MAAGPNKLFAVTVLLTLVLAAGVERLNATGFYGPQVYLDEGGKKLLQSPEFYWDVELKRLARSYKPTEKRVPLRNSEGQALAPGEETTRDTLDEAGATMTADADTQDFADAIKEGRIKPPDPAKATAQQDAARKFIAAATDKTTDPLPDEFPSEFADYHKGALAYKLGKWDEARNAWETLLQRPGEERHYRSVWAAFMLGKAALKAGDPAAVKWFASTRELGKTGFADSLGLAADSYGWEGRSEWKQGYPEKAAKLFLMQLALGDEGAIVSLKALIPDRTPIDGMLNYGPEPDAVNAWTEEKKREEEARTLLALKAAAKDPLLRQLVTVHVLATESDPDLNAEAQSDGRSGGKAETISRCARWLSVVTEAGIEHLENADYLGWVAYVNGDYKGAERWLKLADPNTPAALWLSAKLLRRAGKLDQAAAAMAQAQQAIAPISAYTGWTDNQTWDQGGAHWSFPESASGDLGALQLELAHFIPALETFLKSGGNEATFTGEFELGGLWNDMAFIAERVLGSDELKGFVDRQPVPEGTPANGGDFPIVRLRYLLGRRLVREDRYTEAASYLKAPYDKVLAVYVKALQAGANENLPKRERAKAWFTAAWLARHFGMEIMGTEGAPDGFAEGGDFEIPDLAKQQETGFYEPPYAEDGKKSKVPIVLRPTKEELQRLSKTKTSPDLRFHYRVIAGALAVRAAGFLEDNTEELADVLNTAGLWVKDRDEKLGDRYFQILKNRAPKTKIGRLALSKHWFVNETGPWSEEQAAAEEKLRKDLGISTE